MLCAMLMIAMLVPSQPTTLIWHCYLSRRAPTLCAQKEEREYKKAVREPVKKPSRKLRAESQTCRQALLILGDHLADAIPRQNQDAHTISGLLACMPLSALLLSRLVQSCRTRGLAFPAVTSLPWDLAESHTCR